MHKKGESELPHLLRFRGALYRRATPDYLLAAQVEEALYAPANEWVFHATKQAKQALLTAYSQLSPEAKSWLDRDVARAVREHHGGDSVVAYRYEKSGRPTRALSGTSLTTQRPRWRSHAFRIPASVILMHWGQDLFPLSSMTYEHEAEIILKPQLDEQAIEDLGTVDPGEDDMLDQQPHGTSLPEILRKRS